VESTPAKESISTALPLLLAGTEYEQVFILITILWAEGDSILDSVPTQCQELILPLLQSYRIHFSEKGFRKVLDFAKHQPKNTFPRKSKNAGQHTKIILAETRCLWRVLRRVGTLPTA